MKKHRTIIRREDGTLRVTKDPSGEDVAQQQFKEQCDINNIMKNYMQTGEISHLNPKTGVYGDFSDVKNYQESLDLVIKAKETFDQLPAKVRTRFNNNPKELVEFCNDPKNIEEAIDLGLADEKLRPIKSGPPEEKTPKNNNSNT